MRILVTGASGFVGSALLNRLVADRKYDITAAVRQMSSVQGNYVQFERIGNIAPDTDWRSALRDVAVVVHAAARVHVMHNDVNDPFTEFHRVNASATLNLARQAMDAGVRRFVFISSIKVNGEQTFSGAPFKPDAEPSPVEPYGVSKLEAELFLREIARNSDMDVVIIRPPLVYGPGVKANFLSMMRWLNKGVPLPFGAIHNRRSLVGLDNLVDLIAICVEHPAATNQIFLASDGDDLSTTELLRRMGFALGKPARLFHVPGWALMCGAALLGKQALSRRLCGSLQVDITKTRNLLGWSPPVSVNEGLKLTAQYFLAMENH